MPLSNCPRCGKVFNKMRTPVCPPCEHDEELDYEKVRVALQQQSNQTAEDVAESTGVEVACVLRLIDDGRIANVSISESIRCGQCGAPAISTTKRLCERCLHELNMRFAAEQSKIVLPPRKTLEIEKSRSVRDAVDDKRR